MSQFTSPLPSSSPHSRKVIPNEEVSWHLEVFAPAHQLVRNASEMYTWTREGAMLWEWYVTPLFEALWVSHYISRPRCPTGSIYCAKELDEAFRNYNIPHPQCPCASQETDPAIIHYYRIWVVQKPGVHHGKVAAGCPASNKGCNTWSMFFKSYLYIILTYLCFF
jgi:hypothetical protein